MERYDYWVLRHPCGEFLCGLSMTSSLLLHATKYSQKCDAERVAMSVHKDIEVVHIVMELKEVEEVSD